MKETIIKIEAIIRESDNMKGSYFFTPPTNASGRRYYERVHSHDEISWVDGKDTYTAKYIVDCSCKNVYARGEYTKNGVKTNITSVKNSLKRLKNREVN